MVGVVFIPDNVMVFQRINPRRWAAQLGSLAILSGCAALAPLQPPAQSVELPLAWSAAQAASGQAARVDDAALVDWWTRFGDAQLSALVRAALRSNTSVNSAQAALQLAQAQRDLASAALWPQLGSSASAQRGTAGGQSTGNRLQAGLDANWLPDVFGVTRSAVSAADANVAASAASLGDVRVQLAAEVALNVLLLRSAQARLAIATENLATQQETLQITRWREQAGLVTTLESAQASAAAAQTAALLPTLETSIRQTQHGLAVLTGEPPAALLATLAAAAPLPQADDALNLMIPADTLRQRADVRAAELQVTAARARVDQAEAQRWPSFAIGGSLGVSAASVSALSQRASVLGSLLASVNLPLFDGGAARAGVRVQQAALSQAEQGYRAAVLAALKEVEDALVSLRGDRLRLVSLRQAADAASIAATLARQRYASGLVDFQTVLDTQRTQLGTQDSLASAAADVSADHVRLFTALGGGWQPEENETRP